MLSNASQDLAGTANAFASARKGATFTGIIVTKKGEVQGGLLRGNDMVHVVVVTGYSYRGLVRRSQEKLRTMDVDTILAEMDSRGIKDGKGNPIVRKDVEKAITDLDTSFQSTLDGTNEATTDHVFDPLVVDGETVHGARVYKCVANTGIKCHCRNCNPTDTRAPVPGQINLSGLKIGETVIEPAANGPKIPPKSRADVVVKNILRARLPIGRFVSYAFAPGDDYILRVGGAAALAATDAGVTTDPAKVNEAMELLAG